MNADDEMIIKSNLTLKTSLNIKTKLDHPLEAAADREDKCQLDLRLYEGQKEI